MMSVAGSQQAAPNITLAAPDEDMELGSDAGLNEDNEIEIDFPTNQDDDFMIDARSENGQDAQNTDYQMNDDSFDGGILLATEDEHLANASNVGLENTFLAQPAMPLSENDLIDYDDGDDDAPEENVLPGSQGPSQSLEHIAMSTSLEPKLSDIQQVPTPRADSPARYPSVRSHPMSRQGSQPDQANNNVSSAHDNSETHSTSEFPAAESTNLEVQAAFEDEEQTNLQPDSTVDQGDFTNYSIDEGADVHPPPFQEATELETADVPHTRSSLHPVTVNWNNEEYHLFRFQEEDDPDVYFTADESLAQAPISSLFAACRNTLGDEISGDDELEMDLQSIGLFINEDSVHCSNYTFNNILETYVLLQGQDGISDPGPLYVTLTTNSRFSSRLESLREAASEGKGLSSLTFLQALDRETGNEEESYEDAQYSAEGNGDGDYNAQYHEESQDGIQFADHHTEDNLEEPYPVAHDDDQAEQHNESGSVERIGTNKNLENLDQAGNDSHEFVDLDEIAQTAEEHVDFQPPEHTTENSQINDGEATSNNNLDLGGEVSTQQQSTGEVENELIDYSDEEAEVEPNEQEPGGDHSTSSSTIQGDEQDSSHLATGDNSTVPEGFTEDGYAKSDANNTAEEFNVQDPSFFADEYNEPALVDYSGLNDQEGYGDIEFQGLAQEQFETTEWGQQNAEYSEEPLGQDYDHDTAAYDQDEHTYEEPSHDDVSYVDTSLYDQDNADTLDNGEEDVGDHGDADHGNFDYSEFNDQPIEGLAENNEIEEEHTELEQGFEVVLDSGNEEEGDISHHTVDEPLAGPTQSSPPQKRSFDELVADEANGSNDPQDIKRVRPS